MQREREKGEKDPAGRRIRIGEGERVRRGMRAAQLKLRPEEIKEIREQGIGNTPEYSEHSCNACALHTILHGMVSHEFKKQTVGVVIVKV